MRQAATTSERLPSGTRDRTTRTQQEAAGNSGHDTNCSTLARGRASDRASNGCRVRGPLTDGLDAFGSETVPLPLGPVRGHCVELRLNSSARRDWSAPLAALKWVGVMVLSATTAAAAVWEYQRRTAARATGSFTIQTTPPGLAVRIDGRESGVTPLTDVACAGIVCRTGGHRRPTARPHRQRQRRQLRSSTTRVAGRRFAAGRDRGRPSHRDRAFGTDHHGRRHWTGTDAADGPRSAAGEPRRRRARSWRDRSTHRRHQSRGDGLPGRFADSAGCSGSRLAQRSIHDSARTAGARQARRHDRHRSAHASCGRARHRIGERTDWLSIDAPGGRSCRGRRPQWP